MSPWMYQLLSFGGAMTPDGHFTPEFFDFIGFAAWMCEKPRDMVSSYALQVLGMSR